MFGHMVRDARRRAPHHEDQSSHRIKKSGTEADRPTVPGGRGGPGARSGGGWRGAFPKPKNSRNAGVPDWTGRSLFAGFGGPPGAATVPSGEVDATGVSPLACSRPTSRRGQTKSSARPAGGASGSPLTSVRAASASTAAGRDPGPPSNWSVPTEDATSGRIGPASGRGAGWPGTALASGVAGSVGSAIGDRGPPSNWSVPTEDATSGRIGPASGRGAGWPGTALASGVAGSVGSAIGAERAAKSRVISRST